MSSPSGPKASTVSLWLLEPLEARVAPAVLFGHVDGSIADGDGNAYAQFDANTAQAAGADAVYLFHAGDKLILDTNGNNQLDKGEVTELAVKTGAAAVFFKDLKDGGTTWDITGVAASDKFGGVINANVRGDIATLLAATQTDGVTSYAMPVDFATHLATLQTADISNLAVNGFVTGNVIAGGNILGLRITDFNPATHQAVGNLFAGIAGDGAVVNFSATTNAAYDATLQHDAVAEGTDGGSIRHVTIVGGVGKIVAGDGGASSTGVGGDGGSISNIRLFAQTSADHLALDAGDGGDGVLGGGDGGRIFMVRTSGDLSQGGFYAGDGGDGHSELSDQPLDGADGGDGGTIANIHLGGKVVGAGLNFIAGDGGDGSGDASGGNGGSLHGAVGKLAQDVAVYKTAGDGGSSDSGDAKGGTSSGVKLTWDAPAPNHSGDGGSGDQGTLGMGGSGSGPSSGLVLTGSNTYTGGATMIGTGGLTLTVTGPMVITGGGALVLTGSNTYTGATTLSSDTLNVSEVGSGASLTISGSQAVTKSGIGDLVFSGSNSYTGSTTVTAGTLNVSNGSFDLSRVVLGPGATLSIHGAFSPGNFLTVGDKTYTFDAASGGYMNGDSTLFPNDHWVFVS